VSTNTVPAAPIPAGFSADDWVDTQTSRPWRLIWGPEHNVGGGATVVRASATQYIDGAIDEADGDEPAVHINVYRDWGISTKHARDLAAAILEVTDEADRLVTTKEGTG